MSGLFLALLMGLSSNRVKADGEPPLIDILTTTLGFDVAETTVETFVAGRYEITLYAEYASYCHENTLSWYEVGTSDFNLIFEGPEGAVDSGMVDPPLTRSFTICSEFGLSLWSPDQGGHRFFTETHLNPDAPVKHAMVYQNLDDPTMFLIGFENLEGGGDFDYNDMVLSLKRGPLPVGGVWSPVNRVCMLTPYIGLVSMILSVAAVSGIVVKRIKKK